MSFVGDPLDRAARYPLTAELAADEGFKNRLSSRLGAAVRALQAGRPDLEIVTQDLRAQGDDSYLLAFALDGENVETQLVDDRLSVAYELQVLVLVLNLSKDPSRQRVVTSYPVRVRYHDLASAEPTPAQQREVFDRLLSSPAAGMPDVVDAWCKRALAIKLRERQSWLRVRSIEFTESAATHLAATADQAAAIAQRATSLLEAGLSSALDIPIIPHSPGRVPNRMALSLANVDASQTFQLAAPDYSVGVTVRDMRLVSANGKTAGGHVQTGLAYGALFVARLDEEAADAGAGPKRLLEAVFKRVDTVVFTGARRLSTPQQFSKVVANFADELAANIASPDVSWITRSKSDADKKAPVEIAAGFQQFSKKLI
jgi:hypothetical protein